MSVWFSLYSNRCACSCSGRSCHRGTGCRLNWWHHGLHCCCGHRLHKCHLHLLGLFVHTTSKHEVRINKNVVLSNELIKPNFCFDLSHRLSTTVSLETRNSRSKDKFMVYRNSWMLRRTQIKFSQTKSHSEYDFTNQLSVVTTVRLNSTIFVLPFWDI